MIFNNKIEILLGLRYYSGGSTSGSGTTKSSSSSSGAGNSVSSSRPQMTPQQLLSLYQTALPTMLNTASTASKANSPALQAANQGAVSGVNAINMNGLSPGEANAVERSTNQQNLATGNLGNSNATNTIKNAMNFGGAFNSKIPLLNASTNTASTAANAGTGNLAATSALFSPIASNATAPIANSNSMFSSASSGSGTGSSQNSGISVGCFLTTACCEWRGLPDDCEELEVLRKFRDEYVPKELVQEYYKIAPKIVEKIRGNKFILEIIYDTIKKCVHDIKQEHYTQALDRYVYLVRLLKKV